VAARDPLVEQLEDGGFVAAAEEAAELRTRAAGDAALLEVLVARRLTGEPLAWITGTAEFCGVTLRVDRGVYVPRWQSEPLAERAAARLPALGSAVDVCTGCGAIAAVLMARRPDARIRAGDADPAAVACARSNGVDAHRGDLLDALGPPPPASVDVVVAVVPYVPTPSLALLQRDTFTFESTLSYDGGPDGLALVRRLIAGAAPVLRHGGALLLELGGDQAEAVRADLQRHGFSGAEVLRDEDGDVRGVAATRL
jgi:release factor glutamine methyltransferase